MATEHKEAAAALLARADEVVIPPGEASTYEDRVREARDQIWALRFEALVHAVLYVGDRLAGAGRPRTRVDY